jgi:tetratricopeptide (TPR) repeat protein
VAIDRATALRTAETLLPQGKLDRAIAEYPRVVDDQPRDWNTATVLGDLYGRAGDTDKAVTQCARIAAGFHQEGFLSKAGALYKKILNVKPGDEHARLQTAEIAAAQGLLVDARMYLHAAMADALESVGDVARAFALSLELQADTTGFRDVNERVNRLARAQARG